MSSNREGFTVRVLHSGSAVPAGVGFVVDERHIVTCAHVVNSALGRDKRAQEKPGLAVRVDVDFPLLGDQGPPMRGCRVEAWAPPPTTGIGGEDMAGLTLIGEALPVGAGPARLAERASRHDPAVQVFGYPDDPPRHDQGAWSALRIRGFVGQGFLQIDSDLQSAIRVQPGYSGSPVVVEGEAGDEVVGMLAVASRNGEGKDAYAIPIFQLADQWPDVLGSLTVPMCPYRGLESFTVEDAKAGVFVGREEEVDQLHAMVRRQPLVVVTGPSGVGKSSLVNAGLGRILQDEGWITRVLRPEGIPFEALADTLAGLDQPGSTPTLVEQEKWVQRLRSEGIAALGTRLSRLRKKPILICLDQFEQILDPGICDPRVKADFLDLLLRAHSVNNLRLVCTLRADFLSQLLEYPDAGVRLRDCLFMMSPMGLERMERVITEPAAVRGVRYVQELANLIARDAGGGGGLPLMGFALTELWPYQRQRQITLADYYRVGGVAGALSVYAERVHEELLDKFTEAQIRRVMLALVRSRGGASEATRRPVGRTRLGPDWVIAGALAERRLVIIDHDATKAEDSALIAHEALIRAWPRFTGWVDDDADFQHWLIAVEERAAESELLPDTRLAEAAKWLAERPGDVSDEVKLLIERSKAERDRRIAELDDARSRAQESQRLAEESILKAEESFRQAEVSQRQAEARRLAAAAELAIATRGVSLQAAIVLGIQSLRLAAGLEGDTAIRHVLRLAPRLRGRLRHGGPITAVAFSPDGTRVATGGYTACVFEALTGKHVYRLSHHHETNTDHDTHQRERLASDRRVFEVALGPNAEVRLLAKIEAIAFSSDGTRVVTGSDDCTSRVFNAFTGEQICRMDHDGPVRAVAFSPDGSTVVTGSADHSARVFNATTGDEVCRLDHGGSVLAVAFKPDSSGVASASTDRSARIFDAATGTESRRLDHRSSVTALAFSPDGARIATVSGDTVKISNIEDGSQVCQMVHDGDVLSIAISQDGTRLATGSRNDSAQVFDASSGSQLCKLDHGGVVGAVAFSPDGSYVATGSADGSARTFDARSGAVMRRLVHDDTVNAVAISPDGIHVATGSADGVAFVFDAGTGADIWHFDHHTKVTAAAYSPDGRHAASASGRIVRVFDALTGALVFQVDQRTELAAIAFSPDGAQLATCSVRGNVRVFDAFNGTQVGHLDLHLGRRFPDGALSINGTRLAVGGWDDPVQVFDIFTGAKDKVWPTSVTSGPLALSPDATKLVISSAWGGEVHDAVTRAHVSISAGEIAAFAFSPDGTQLATGGIDHSARVFDTTTGVERCRLDHGAEVVAVAFSPDGTRVATGSADHSARIFSIVTGSEVCRLEHSGRVAVVAFSPDGTHLCTGSDGRVQVWVIDRDRLIEQAESRLTRDLTEQEWRRLFPNARYQNTGPRHAAAR
jgi:WD40 repeat protein/energy-coupling factor transporter ATP-binding protein EcfA2